MKFSPIQFSIALTLAVLAPIAALAATPSIDVSSLKDTDQIQVSVYSEGRCSHESNLWVGPAVVRSESELYEENTDHRFRFKITAKELRDLSKEGKLAVDLSSVCDTTGAKIEIKAAGKSQVLKPALSHGGRHDTKISFKM